MLYQQIKEQMKDAMRAKDEVRLTTLRGVMAACTNELVAQKRTPQDELSDEDVLKVIKGLAKQRKDSIEQYESGGRPELAEGERAELAILEEFLPKMMSKDEIRPVVEAKKAEMNIQDKSQMGIFMGAVMKELGGRADGADVRDVVMEVLGDK